MRPTHVVSPSGCSILHFHKQFPEYLRTYRCLNATIWARYRWVAPKVWVAATDPAAVCTRSSVVISKLFDCRCVKPVPAVIVVKTPESSTTAPKIRSPLTVVMAAVLVIAFDPVVPFATFFATTSTGLFNATPWYSWIRSRWYPALLPNLAVTYLPHPFTFAQYKWPSTGPFVQCYSLFATDCLFLCDPKHV